MAIVVFGSFLLHQYYIHSINTSIMAIINYLRFLISTVVIGNMFIPFVLVPVRQALGHVYPDPDLGEQFVIWLVTTAIATTISFAWERIADVINFKSGLFAGFY